MTTRSAVVIQCRYCDEIDVLDKDSIKRCEYCDTKDYDPIILWERDTGIEY